MQRKKRQRNLSLEETYVEDDVNAANDIRRRIWRIKDALSWIAPDAEVLAKVGAVLWRLSERDREAGCAVWVNWLKHMALTTLPPERSGRKALKDGPKPKTYMS